MQKDMNAFAPHEVSVSPRVEIFVLRQPVPSVVNNKWYYHLPCEHSDIQPMDGHSLVPRPRGRREDGLVSTAHASAAISGIYTSVKL